MKFLVLAVSALAAAASAAYLPAGVSPLNLGYSAAPVQAAGLPFYPYGALGLGHLLPYGGLQSYSYPYVPALSQAPATVAVSAAPSASAAPAASVEAAPGAQQKSVAPVTPVAPVAPVVPAVPEVQPVDVPKPVEETPEVKQARERFMALWLAAAKAAAESPDTGDASAPAAAVESASSRRRRDVASVLQPGVVRSWSYGASVPSYTYSAPLGVASPHVQSVVYPGSYNYYY